MKDYTKENFTIKEKFVKLLGVNDDPCVSVIVNKVAPSPKNEKFRIAVKNAVRQAIEKLKEKGYDKRLVQKFADRLMQIAEELKYERDFQGVAIFLSPSYEEVITLPYKVKDKVVVDNTFEIRDLLRTLNRSFQYNAIVLSKKKTRFFEGFSKDLQEVFSSDIPEGVDYYFNIRVSDRIDPAKRESEAMKLYVKDLDDFLRLYSDMYTPLIVLGDKKLVGYFRTHTKRPKKVIGEIYGSYDDERVSVIRDKINEKLDEYIKIRDQQLMERIKDDIDAYNYVSGIQEVWTAAAMKEARILLVEQGYSVEGYSVKDGLFLLLVKPENEEYDYHEDAIDDLTEMVLLQGGEVYFVSEGLLKDYDRVLLTLR